MLLSMRGRSLRLLLGPASRLNPECFQDRRFRAQAPFRSSGSKDRVRIDELLEANKALAPVYVLKDDLKSLWSYRRVGWARRFWNQWYARAMASEIAPPTV